MHASFPLNACIQDYKFSSKQCFSYILQILICSIFIIIQFQIFLISIEILSLIRWLYRSEFIHFQTYGVLRYFKKLTSCLIAVCQKVFYIIGLFEIS